ncbi:Glucose/arabinose dehydrogenase, beta-propeller fold [Roseateles sp. YR242]|uniref:lectin n=1 Tax=Roseateles sp. YR242 TaxID=1855305 RepID=UPI0008D50951|nr:lectin [Roseateles sp. YR242]SEK40459.1 Glucose/arabinose dehydrogenase, beta-propeller fold [Roseateles sp. YR242]
MHARNERIRMLTVMVAAALMLLLALMPGQAQAATTLVGQGSSRCLDVQGGASAALGAPMIIYDCHGGTNQSFEFTADGEIRVMNGTRCLDAYQQGTALGTTVVAYFCNGQPNQKWTYNNNGTITGRQSGLCLDVYKGLTAAKTAVILYTCRATSNQVWIRNDGVQIDTTPPTPPSNLSLSNLQCRSATLSWAPSTDNIGVAFYDVYHDGQQMTTVTGSTLATTLTLTPGARWGLYVNARDAAGNVSQASATLSVTVPQCSVDTQPPTVPSGLTAAATGTSVALKWNASTDNVAVAGYDIYRNDVKVGATAGLTYTDSALTPNTGYRYAVSARDAQNNSSARTADALVTTGGSCSTAVCSVAQVATETDLPWGMLALPDGQLLYSRRDVRDVVRLNPSTGVKTVVGVLSNAAGTDGEGGVMGLAASPNFPTGDSWLYIMYTTATDNRIVRVRYVNGALDMSSLQVLLSGVLRNKYHNGGRLRYGPDGKLYVATGDAQNGDFAQNTSHLNGKVLRMNVDGTVPSDNPFGNLVWSYGHRNPQGLAFDAQGRLWEQEFGDSTMDETNLIQKGGNYGWPICEGTLSRSGTGCGTSGFIAPKYTYPVADGSCSGIAIVRQALYVACQRGERLYRHAISGDSLLNVQELFRGTYGRIRTVEPAIDGNLWISTTNGGDKDNIANNSDNKIIKVNLGP